MEVQTVLCHQVDDNNVFLYSRTRRSYGFRQVAVAPPAEVADMVRVWVSPLDPTTDPAWSTTGEWVLKEDHRKTPLYTSSGRYTLKEDVEGKTYDGIGAIPAWLSTIEPPKPEPTLEDAKAAKLADINNQFEAAAGALTAGYPAGERLTWPIQQAEATAWAADSSAPTPYLDGLAESRGIPAADMRQKTLDQTQAFMTASQVLVGTRQRLRDMVEAAPDVAAVDAIVWVSPL